MTLACVLDGGSVVAMSVQSRMGSLIASALTRPRWPGRHSVRAKEVARDAVIEEE
jgi:hypothetical protein